MFKTHGVTKKTCAGYVLITHCSFNMVIVKATSMRRVPIFIFLKDHTKGCTSTSLVAWPIKSHRKTKNSLNLEKYQMICVKRLSRCGEEDFLDHANDLRIGLCKMVNKRECRKKQCRKIQRQCPTQCVE